MPVQATRSPAFTDFLVHELVPWARERFGLPTDPQRTIIGGLGHGGLTAAYSALRYPQTFGIALAQSGAFGWAPADDPEQEWLARQFTIIPPAKVRFHLDVGLLGIGILQVPVHRLDRHESRRRQPVGENVRKRRRPGLRRENAGHLRLAQPGEIGRISCGEQRVGRRAERDAIEEHAGAAPNDEVRRR